MNKINIMNKTENKIFLTDRKYKLTSYTIIHKLTDLRFYGYRYRNDWDGIPNTLQPKHLMSCNKTLINNELNDYGILKKHLRINNINGKEFVEVYIKSLSEKSFIYNELKKHYKILDNYLNIPLSDFYIDYEYIDKEVVPFVRLR
jgi:hypothetical protein